MQELCLALATKSEGFLLPTSFCATVLWELWFIPCFREYYQPHCGVARCSLLFTKEYCKILASYVLDCHSIWQITTGRKYFICYFKSETEAERVWVLPLGLLNCTLPLRIRTAVHRPFLHIIIFIFLSSNTSTSIETTLFSPAAPLIFALTLYKVPPLLSEALWKTFLVSLDGNCLKTKP